MCKQSVWKTIKPSSVIWTIKRKGKQTSKQSIRNQFNQFYLILLPRSVEEEQSQLSFNQMEKSLAKKDANGKVVLKAGPSVLNVSEGDYPTAGGTLQGSSSPPSSARDSGKLCTDNWELERNLFSFWAAQK